MTCKLMQTSNSTSKFNIAWTNEDRTDNEQISKLVPFKPIIPLTSVSAFCVFFNKLLNQTDYLIRDFTKITYNLSFLINISVVLEANKGVINSIDQIKVLN